MWPFHYQFPILAGLMWFARPSTPHPEDFKRQIQSQPTIEDLETAAAKRQAEIEFLLSTGPPYCYSLTPPDASCQSLWVTHNGKRIWVRNADGLDKPGAAVPAAIAIPEDEQHYYDGGVIRAAGPGDPYTGGMYCYPRTEAIAAASPTIARTGEVVRMEAAAEGGNGFFTYEWSGDDGLQSFQRVVNVRYHEPGLKTATVKVTSNGDDSVDVELRVLVVEP